MQSEIYLANGEKVRVKMSVDETQNALNIQKAGVSGLVTIEDAADRKVLVNPSLVTHVQSFGRE